MEVVRRERIEHLWTIQSAKKHSVDGDEDLRLKALNVTVGGQRHNGAGDDMDAGWFQSRVCLNHLIQAVLQCLIVLETRQLVDGQAVQEIVNGILRDDGWVFLMYRVQVKDSSENTQ